MKHHAFIYALYLPNSALSNYEYHEEMQKKFSICLSNAFITRWFKNIGPFRGNYRKTSRFPLSKYSQLITRLLNRYLAFVCLFHPSRFIFADEKPMKEIDLFGRVRRNFVDGTVPVHKMNANSNTFLYYSQLFPLFFSVAIGKGLYLMSHVIVKCTAS